MLTHDLASVSLDDKYTATSGRIYLSGIQALVRLMLVQRWRDQSAGLNTAGFVSGYRGSPLGGLDEALWKARAQLETHAVKFLPGVNEELAATAVWGTQQVHLTGESTVDGVFAMWYGKAPGVDRCGDVFKHMSHAGTSPHGGILLVAGDDHGAYSSTLPNQSDHLFAASMIPMLYPQSVEEYIELGLHGFAMSRFAGLPVGFKALADTVESSGSIPADAMDVQTLLPDDFVFPEGGVHARLSTDTLGVQARKQEALMQDYKIYAAIAYARANRLNRVTIDSPKARLGIVASGKSYRDVLEALEELGIDAEEAGRIGIRLFKVAMPWPLEPDSIREFADGLEEILVVEEKRQIVEYQLKEHLYNWREDVRPRVIGKFDEQGEWVHPRGRWLLPATADFSVAQIARVIAGRVARFHTSDRIRMRLAILDAKDVVLGKAVATPARPAWYCSGCPHNSSTKVPEGSLALAGIGCHVMATAIYPAHNKTTTHMGGEGAPWLGQSWFSRRRHVFANLGDGTYYHSGSMAVRAAVAAGVNITYKILYNDAVAMTGGQQVGERPEGHSVMQIMQSLTAEGVAKLVIVTDEPGKYNGVSLLAGVTVHHRDELDAIQRQFREIAGTTAIIYDQTCATEKRRRRKRGKLVDPAKRVVINELVCEGCGDCSIQSNCLSVEPLETDFGRKRQINQNTCNKDYSCVKGFCPSFVTIEGGELKKPKKDKRVNPFDAALPAIPQPLIPNAENAWGIVVAGVGGTGVITIGQLLGMAAHLEGKGVITQDAAGLAQKGGATWSHIQIANDESAIHCTKVGTAEADLVIACDSIVAANKSSLAVMREGRTFVALNTHGSPTATLVNNADWSFPGAACESAIAKAVGSTHLGMFDAEEVAVKLLGDSLYTNPLMLGYAWQQGKVPLSYAALMRAIELNGVQVDNNKAAFEWGRRCAHDLAAVKSLYAAQQVISIVKRPGVDEIVAKRVAFLTDYQDAAYAAAYQAFVDKVRAAEAPLNSTRLSEAVAKYLFKLMAYKDEYEVARLHTDAKFLDKIRSQFEGDYKIVHHLAPPLLAKKNDKGELIKQQMGGWIRPAFGLLAKLKGLRGTAFDIFGRTEERKTERALIQQYRASIDEILAKGLTAERLPLAAEIARIPEEIRGYGHVKHRHLVAARAKWDGLMAQWRQA